MYLHVIEKLSCHCSVKTLPLNFTLVLNHFRVCKTQDMFCYRLLYITQRSLCHSLLLKNRFQQLAVNKKIAIRLKFTQAAKCTYLFWSI